jgi:phosphate transport system protein
MHVKGSSLCEHDPRPRPALALKYATLPIGAYHGKGCPDIPADATATEVIERQNMAEVVESMITDTLTAFRQEEIASLTDITVRDDNVDALRYSIFRECITYMMEDPKNISQCTNYIMIARYLERCGDHACKIAEKVHYMVTGERVELK